MFKRAIKLMPTLQTNLKMWLSNGRGVLYDDVLNPNTKDLLHDVLSDLEVRELEVTTGSRRGGYTQLIIRRSSLSQLSRFHLASGGQDFATVMLPFAAAQGLDNVVRSLLKAGGGTESEATLCSSQGK